MYTNAPLALVRRVEESSLENGSGFVANRIVVMEEDGNRFVRIYAGKFYIMPFCYT